jgi:hypothetical protein
MSDLCVITSFFNPGDYESRKRNFRAFRPWLNAPLLAIELGYQGRFFLQPGDADTIVRVSTGDVLWQKERLLNLALTHLPDDCRYVAWIDCDVVFDRPDWLAHTRDALQTHALVQLFSKGHHLARGSDPHSPFTSPIAESCESFGWQYATGALSMDCVAAGKKVTFNPGHAWAMRRSDLERVGFYDAAIVGGGTLLMAATSLGRFDDIITRFQMNRAQADHYHRWAAVFHGLVAGRVAAIPNELYHLWHGDLANRGYGVRFARLAAHGFDPEHDIAPGPEGTWRWSSDKAALHRDIAQYFVDRREDGQ